VEHGLQRPAPRQSADALDKDPPTVSDKVWADAGEVDQHTASRFARNSLLAPTHAPWADIPPGENCRVQTMEVELWQRPPTRRAEDPPSRPTTHRSTLACVFTPRLVRGMTSPRGTPCAGCTHNTAGDPNRNTTLPAAWSTSSERSRLRTDTPLNPNGPSPQAVDGRIMSVLKQHLHVTQEIRNTLTHGHPLTYWAPTRSMRRGVNRPILSAMGKSVAFHHRQRRAGRAVRWALMSAMHSDVAVATI
jgi:hypothetical protein